MAERGDRVAVGEGLAGISKASLKTGMAKLREFNEGRDGRQLVDSNSSAWVTPGFCFAGRFTLSFIASNWQATE